MKETIDTILKKNKRPYVKKPTENKHKLKCYLCGINIGKGFIYEDPVYIDIDGWKYPMDSDCYRYAIMLSSKDLRSRIYAQRQSTRNNTES